MPHFNGIKLRFRKNKRYIKSKHTHTEGGGRKGGREGGRLNATASSPQTWRSEHCCVKEARRGVLGTVLILLFMAVFGAPPSLGILKVRRATARV